MSDFIRATGRALGTAAGMVLATVVFFTATIVSLLIVSWFWQVMDAVG